LQRPVFEIVPGVEAGVTGVKLCEERVHLRGDLHFRVTARHLIAIRGHTRGPVHPAKGLVQELLGDD
jgi:hypothetical protein